MGEGRNIEYREGGGTSIMNCVVQKAETSMDSAKLKEQLLRTSEMTIKPDDFQRLKKEKVVDNCRESRPEVSSTVQVIFE